MLKDIIRSVKLIAYTQSAKANIIGSAICVVLGVILQFINIALERKFGNIFGYMDVGGYFVMIGIVILLSPVLRLGFSKNVDSSPYRVFLNKNFPALLTFFTIAGTVLVETVIGSLGLLAFPDGAETICSSITATAISGLVLVGFSSLIYKLPFWLYIIDIILISITINMLSYFPEELMHLISGESVLRSFVFGMLSAVISSLIIRFISVFLYRKNYSGFWKKTVEKQESMQ